MEINRHIRDFGCDFTLEYNVKNINGNYLLSEEDMDFEMETGIFVNEYAKECFDEIKKLGYHWVKDWSFAGRTNGWFVLLCDDKEVEKIRQSQFAKIENIIKRYLKGYVERLNSFYCAEKQIETAENI